MKRTYILFIIAACVCIPMITSAQHYSSQLSTGINIGKHAQTSESVRAQNVFFEAFGQGLFFTANYDARFNKRRDGLGGRIGVGIVPAFDLFGTNNPSQLLVPVSLNYLLGSNGASFFEIGLGTTFIGGEDAELVGTTSFAYRLQPFEQGFAFRAGFTPIITRDGFFPLWGGLSLGYTF